MQNSLYIVSVVANGGCMRKLTYYIFHVFYAHFWQTGDFAAPGNNETTRITKTYTILCLLMQMKHLKRCYRKIKC